MKAENGGTDNLRFKAAQAVLAQESEADAVRKELSALQVAVRDSDDEHTGLQEEYVQMRQLHTKTSTEDAEAQASNLAVIVFIWYVPRHHPSPAHRSISRFRGGG